MAGPITITDESFALDVDKQPGIVVVDFWAEWCGPCRALGPVIDRLAERYDSRVTFAKLEVDANPETVTRFRVNSIPALLFFKDGVLVHRTVGALPESLLQIKVEQLLEAPVAAPQAAGGRVAVA